MHSYGDIIDLKGVSHTSGEIDDTSLIIVSLNLIVLY